MIALIIITLFGPLLFTRVILPGITQIFLIIFGKSKRKNNRMYQMFFYQELFKLIIKNLNQQSYRYNHSSKQNSNAQNQKMTIEDAKKILGVESPITSREINQQYIKLIKALHPDRGGSEYLSKQVNEAKKILMNSVDKN